MEAISRRIDLRTALEGNIVHVSDKEMHFCAETNQQFNNKSSHMTKQELFL